MEVRRDYIVGFESEDQEYFQDFRLNFGSDFQQFIVLTGDNGAGKTGFLEYILGAASTRYRTNKYDEKEEKLTIEVERLLLWNRLHIEKATLFLKYSNKKQKSTIELKYVNLDIAAYSTNRLFLQTPESMEAATRKNAADKDIQPLLAPDQPLKNIEYWLKIRLLASQQNIVQQVLSVLAKLMPNVSEITYKTDPRYGVVFQYHTPSGIIDAQTLSAGNKVILGLIGDIIIRLWDEQMEVEEVKDLTGIVLIDELEAHLHPKWQRAFPKLLSETFPNVQFVISTHTPMVLLGLPENSVLLHVKNPDDGKIIVEQLEMDVQNMTPQQLLTSPLFGLEQLRSLYNQELEELHTTEDYQALIKRQEVQENIRELAKDFKFKKPDQE